MVGTISGDSYQLDHRWWLSSIKNKGLWIIYSSFCLIHCMMLYIDLYSIHCNSNGKIGRREKSVGWRTVTLETLIRLWCWWSREGVWKRFADQRGAVGLDIPIWVWISGISPAFLTPSTTYLNVESLGQVLSMDLIVFRDALGRVQVETMQDRPVRLDRSNALDLVRLVGRCGEPYQSPLSICWESDAPESSWTRPTMSFSGPLV